MKGNVNHTMAKCTVLLLIKTASSRRERKKPWAGAASDFNNSKRRQPVQHAGALRTLFDTKRYYSLARNHAYTPPSWCASGVFLLSPALPGTAWHQGRAQETRRGCSTGCSGEPDRTKEKQNAPDEPSKGSCIAAGKPNRTYIQHWAAGGWFRPKINIVVCCPLSPYILLTPRDLRPSGTVCTR